ncbi:MAG: YggS family pyridoxal phosphate-dependent enzyme [Sporomusaceae bacterium]|nr:YggS family pyridoxal phosphate-dependent enzyme [Sporomusaceae bacterium]
MSIAENYAVVVQNIQSAREKRAAQTGMDQPVQLIAVTKNHTIAEMEEAYELGMKVVGENRVQEALAKFDHFQDRLEYHLLGHLQTNKVKQAVSFFHLIHSVDSLRLMQQIDRHAAAVGKVQAVLLEVNVGEEATKFGLAFDEVIPFLAEASQFSHVSIEGLMTVAPHFDDPEATRPIFRKLYQLFTAIKDKSYENCNMKWLSMGMTNDYPIAIEEGANVVRVGTAIFGERNYAVELTRR